ncbi:pollen-specific leucine-rich repeat extensin-like protein 4 [Cornus florida]|uniref:pollen-specific leucine-rich repeat extensin-like protein 4 n=1 Tax=Cornus florida TaxID=4283 RepID=UPI00289869A3|nr:pollen-specific leucine-rich repeat extensin-like protein 4 [Cornus florida]
MKVSGYFLIFTLLFSSFSSFSLALSNAEASYIAHRQLTNLSQNNDLSDGVGYDIDPKLNFANPRLKKAYIALQAWKKAISSDPHNLTGNWVGENVCAYNGIVCKPAIDDPKLTVVSGIYLSHGDIAGYLPLELGLLTDLTTFTINSNRFCGIIPNSFSKLQHLEELDLSNNQFNGSFPAVLLELNSLVHIDIRYNNFEGIVTSDTIKELYTTPHIQPTNINSANPFIPITTSPDIKPTNINSTNTYHPIITSSDIINKLHSTTNIQATNINSTIPYIKNITSFDTININSTNPYFRSITSSDSIK